MNCLKSIKAIADFQQMCVSWCMAKTKWKKDCWLKHQSGEKYKKCWSSVSPSVKSDTFYRKIKSCSAYNTKWAKHMSLSENNMV